MSPATPLAVEYKCPRLVTAADQGRAAHVNGNDEVPPFENGTGEYFAWLSGWAGATAIARAFAEDHPKHGKEGT